MSLRWVSPAWDFGGNRVCVTGQAARLLPGIPPPEVPGNLPGARAGENSASPGVPVLHHPFGEFILNHKRLGMVRLDRLEAAVTTSPRTRTRSHPAGAGFRCPP